VAQHDPEDIAARRKRAMKTAWLLAAVASLVFLGFILSGVLRS
jgi:hypothetical protein